MPLSLAKGAVIRRWPYKQDVAEGRRLPALDAGVRGAPGVGGGFGADQAAVTLGNTDGEIAGLTISDPPTQAEVQALRDKAEQLADDVRALSALACRGVARGASGDWCMRCWGRWWRWGA